MSLVVQYCDSQQSQILSLGQQISKHRTFLSESEAENYFHYSKKILVPYYYPWSVQILFRHSEKLFHRSFLDVAGGAGHLLEMIATECPSISGHMVDLSSECVEFACAQFEKSFPILRASIADMHCLPFEDEKFHNVMCHDSLHHSPNLKVALAELARVCEENLFLFDVLNLPDKEKEEEYYSTIRNVFCREEADETIERFKISAASAYPLSEVKLLLKSLGFEMFEQVIGGLSYAIFATRTV